MQVLEALGFEFGEVAQITDEWEIHFDQLLEWLSWRHDESNMVLGGQKPGWYAPSGEVRDFATLGIRHCF
jgi:hypothetical protein